MKITINGQDYYITWHYNEFISKQYAHQLNIGISATCLLKEKQEKPKEGEKLKDKHVLKATVTVKFAEGVLKQGLRNISLAKLIDKWVILTKEQKKYIWNTYIESQNGNISPKKPKLKSIIKSISALNKEQKEAVLKRFTSKEPGSKLIQMAIESSDEAIHA